MDVTVDMEALSARYERVRSGIPAHVKLVAVSKTRSVAEIRALYDLGHRAFGENYPQELREKQPQLPADIEWHFIGHLQSNKVKYIAPFVDMVHSVDGVKLLDELEKRAAQAGRVIDVLLQVHIAEEESKHGLDEHELRSLLKGWESGKWVHLRPRGLMGMATLTEDRTKVAGEFRGLANLYRALVAENGPVTSRFDTLSMGMSDDAQIAIDAGSTLVRIGTALFGPRPTKATP